jgi:hypothetical protein
VPERLDRITVKLGRGDVTLTWDARQALLARLQHVQTTARIRASFDAVGASRPVELTPGQRTTLLEVLQDWFVGGGGSEAMPEGLFHLRNALIADQHDAEE